MLVIATRWHNLAMINLALHIHATPNRPRHLLGIGQTKIVDYNLPDNELGTEIQNYSNY